MPDTALARCSRQFLGSATVMGYLMITALATLNATEMFAAVVLLSIVEIIRVYGITLVQRRLLHWSPQLRDN